MESIPGSALFFGKIPITGSEEPFFKADIIL